MHNFPTLAGLNPSTSFIYVIVLNASFMSKCIGIGLCNKIPFIVLSSFSFFISSINSSCSIFSSNKYSTYSTPTSAHALLLFRTYTFEAGLLPTIITASLGYIPFCFNSSHLIFSSSLIFFANFLPSIISAIVTLRNTDK